VEQIKKTPASFWILLWGLGLAGQLCWNIENQWFNTFIYAKIAKDSSIVAWMVMTSAIVTTISTFIFGTWSDRLGTRRRFVSMGYICWGVFTIAFGLTEYIAKGTTSGANIILLAAVLAVLADNIMSFFGSMAYDSSLNAWCNDNTTDTNRGQIGAVLATLPVIGTIVGTLLGGLLIGEHDNYQRLFWTMGGLVIATGIVSFFIMKDVPTLKPHREGSFIKQFVAVFNIEVFKGKREMILACVTAGVFFIGFNIYFVHLGNWMIYNLGFNAADMGLIEGIGLIVALFLAIPAGKVINRNRTPWVMIFAVVINIIGLVEIFLLARPGSVNTEAPFSMQNLPIFIGLFLVGGGYILCTQAMNMWIKQLYPEGGRGQFEGVRIVFFTLIPMVIGTILGNIVVKTGAGTAINEFGITENIPTESIFFWGAILTVLTFIPLYFATNKYFARMKNGADGDAA
jgi:MFS family permease